MAKDLANKQFMADFDNLPKDEQDKIIQKLQKAQEKKPKKPNTSSHEGRKPHATEGDWD